MFSRNPDNPNDDLRRTGLQPVPMPPARDVPQPPIAPTSPPDLSMVAREDQFDGTISARHVVRVLGQVKGTIEAPMVTVEEGARVEADVTANEVVIAGEYAGNMTCRQRLEVRPTGRVSGHLETLRLMLHEGAAMDGEIHMLKPSSGTSAPAASVSAPAPARPADDPAARPPATRTRSADDATREPAHPAR